MKITFPYMGTSHIAFKQLVEQVGHEPVVPPQPSKRTLTYGTKYSPEFACIPFKVLLGSYIEALENGAEMIIASGGVGPCRAGIYGMLHEKILKDLGYEFEMVIFEPPKRDIKDFLGKINRIIKPNNISWVKFWKEFKLGWDKLKLLDETEILASKVRPREITKGETTTAYKKCLQIIDRSHTSTELQKARLETGKILKNIPQDLNRDCPKVGLIGEIYVVLEPFINLDIETTLGEMGVETHRSIYLTDWTRENAKSKGIANIEDAARPYLTELVGGHGINSVGETVIYANEGFDGVVQLAPFTCIPEIVAKSIMPQISKDLDISVMTIFLDEQTGKAGIQTRLEAFIDLLKQKRLERREPASCMAT
ncbi:putative nucleotide-binding protein (sugar kinase/HSP70/actin superfamily) [Desulfitispora alkaliphila]|uniref:CoA protein activase n=1 Tax=Desulfitispora alkaliphila TaxID=622674 RepID=UPI003D1A44B7